MVQRPVRARAVKAQLLLLLGVTLQVQLAQGISKPLPAPRLLVGPQQAPRLGHQRPMVVQQQRHHLKALGAVALQMMMVGLMQRSMKRSSPHLQHWVRWESLRRAH